MLDRTVISLVENEEYQAFMSQANTSFDLKLRLKSANDHSLRIFGLQQTFRKAWNEAMLRRPVHCGKAHESATSDITTIDCKNRRNPCCGHPELNEFFHVIGIGGWLSKRIKDTLLHPVLMLRSPIELDNEAQDEYGTKNFPGVTLSNEDIPEVQRRLKEREREIYEHVIHPYLEEISHILQDAYR